MCGIAGWVGAPPPEPLGERLHRLAHRGPDDWGIWATPKHHVELGHRRLAILDLSPAGHQPMRVPGVPATIVFNGEIYNFRELRADLLSQGVTFQSSSDTEVLLQLYLRDGEAMLECLNGIFAFAIWDERDETLFCARDPIGAKPFYWGHAPGCFHFASELKIFLGLPGLEPRIEPDGLLHHLTYLWAPSPLTAFRGIHKLEPGHCMRVDAQGNIQNHRSFFTWDYREDNSRSAEAWAHELRGEVLQAVERQLVSDVPVGLFLSGGLDSSAIAAAYRKARPDTPIHAFCSTSGKGDGFAEDLPFAEEVAAHLGIQLHRVDADRLDLDRWSEILWHLEEPQGDPAIQHVDAICRQSKAMGLRVLLSGAGGDDLFTGYRRHLMAAHESLRLALPSSLRRGVSILARALPQRPPFVRRLSKGLTGLELPTPDRLAAQFEWLAPDLIDELLTASTKVSPRKRLGAKLQALPPGTSAINQALYLETRGFLPDHNLNYTDKLSMAHGVETRVPLLDLELVRLANRIPGHVKLRRSTPKWVLKAAMEPLLPARVIHRPKTGFGAPLRVWLAGPMKAEFETLLDQVCATRSAWFHPPRVRQLWQDTQAGRVDGAYALWSIATTSLWADRFGVS